MNEIAKSRIKILVVLLVGVALLHVVAIFFFSGAKVAPPKNAEVSAVDGKDAAKDVAPEPQSRYRKKSDNPNFGKPFNYSTAYVGNMPNLPASSDASAGFMVDLNTRNVLWMKNYDKSVPIASMVKMMTLYTAFGEFEKHPEWSLATPVKITSGATKVARTGIIWLDTRETMPLEDLLKALTIKSANDAAYQVAEFAMQGNVNAFVAKMNANASQLGMKGSKFISPHGLPDKVRGNSVSTAEGMCILGERLLEYPDIMKWASTQQTFIRNGRTELTNTNHLVNPRWAGIDGLKTGYIGDAGYCLTFTGVRKGRRIIGCITGFSSAKKGRDPFARKLVNWGFDRAADIDAGKTAPPKLTAVKQKSSPKSRKRK